MVLTFTKKMKEIIRKMLKNRSQVGNSAFPYRQRIESHPDSITKYEVLSASRPTNFRFLQASGWSVLHGSPREIRKHGLAIRTAV